MTFTDSGSLARALVRLIGLERAKDFAHNKARAFGQVGGEYGAIQRAYWTNVCEELAQIGRSVRP